MTDFDRLLATLDAKLEEFKTEFKEGQEKVAVAAARKARQEQSTLLRRKLMRSKARSMTGWTRPCSRLKQICRLAAPVEHQTSTPHSSL